MTSLDDALALHEAGHLDAAEAAYRALLAAHPDDPEALHLLGVLHHQREEHRAALPLITRAIALDPERALFHGNLGSVLLALGDPPRAIAAYQSALALAPEHANTRFNLGVALEADGQAEAALDCFDAVAHTDPQHPRAALNAAIVHKKLGRREAAIAGLQALLARDPENALADFHLATLTGTTPARAPDSYLRHTFDAAAADFDRHLQQELGYDTPARLVQLLSPTAPGGWRVLDLGCGTGLCGVAIAPWASHLSGIDLSGGMLAKAAERGLYQRLVQAELLAAMRDEAAASYDVMLAADVLIYLGELAELFASARRLLVPGGRFACSSEALEAHPGLAAQPYALLASGRYAHSTAYLRQLAAAQGLIVEQLLAAPARHEAGQPVAAWLLVLRCPA